MSKPRKPRPAAAPAPAGRGASRGDRGRRALAVFAERGYHGASIDEIARRSGVTRRSCTTTSRRSSTCTGACSSARATSCSRCGASSSPATIRRRSASRGRWTRGRATCRSAPVRAAHVLQRDHRRPRGGGDPPAGAGAVGRGAGRDPGREPGAETHRRLRRAKRRWRWRPRRSAPGSTGLAIWWSEHPHVPRERIVTTAINAVWVGFERVRRGEGWTA